MRRLLPILVILGVALAGLWVWQNRQTAAPVDTVADKTQPPLATTETGAAAQLADEAADETARAAQQAAADEAAAEAAADAAADAAAMAADAAAEAMRTAEEIGAEAATEAARTAEAAAEAAIAAADRAARAVATPNPSETAEDVVSAARDAAEAAQETADAAEIAARIETLLTPEGFDRDEVMRMIAEAPIPETQKATLRRLIETAGNNPQLLSAALEQVKALMR
ncbi:MAG: hypothetical protein P3W94_006720 [Paracoccus sp. (in: a-proteobacteria)]|nr:hypothetical protein [Paracoccus sp. (in: a-proteobacteria)]